MKTIIKLGLCVAIAASLSTFKAAAATSERLLTFTLSGFYQTNGLSGEVAAPFRATTKDIVAELAATLGTNLTNGALLVIDSLDDTNVLTKIVARSKTKTETNEVDVTEFFQFDQGEAVATTKYVTNVLKSATFYAIDHFQFSTLGTDTNGFELKFQGLTKESQRASVKPIGVDKREVISSTIKSDGTGEFRFVDVLFGPVKGSVAIGAPKFFP
jgi:hypothetical protein